MASFSHGIELDEVLFDVRKYPLSLDEWRQFLTKEQADENLGFWLDAQTYKERVKGEQTVVKGKPVQLKGLDKENETLLSNPVQFAREIVHGWIGPTASISEINISARMRQELTDAVVHSSTSVEFTPAQLEVRQMMVSGERFARFVQRQLTQNITDAEGNLRASLGFLVFVLAFIGGLLLKLLVDDGQLPNYALAILLFVPFLLSSYMMISGQART